MNITREVIFCVTMTINIHCNKIRQKAKFKVTQFEVEVHLQKNLLICVNSKYDVWRANVGCKKWYNDLIVLVSENYEQSEMDNLIGYLSIFRQMISERERASFCANKV